MFPVNSHSSGPPSWPVLGSRAPALFTVFTDARRSPGAPEPAMPGAGGAGRAQWVDPLVLRPAMIRLLCQKTPRKAGGKLRERDVHIYTYRERDMEREREKERSKHQHVKNCRGTIKQKKGQTWGEIGGEGAGKSLQTCNLWFLHLDLLKKGPQTSIRFSQSDASCWSYKCQGHESWDSAGPSNRAIVEKHLNPGGPGRAERVVKTA